MNRFLQLAVLTLCTRKAFATGVLNMLLAGSIPLLTSSVSPTSINYSYPAASFTAPSSTCSGSEGVPPYTFAWSWASGGASLSFTAATSATTGFTVSGAAINTTYTGTAQCLVTDRRSISSPYSDVAVSLTRIPLFPPSLSTATLTSGNSPDGSYTLYGFATSAGSPTLTAFGSISPTTDYNSYAVDGIYWFSGGAPNGQLYLSVAQPAPNANYVTELIIGAGSHATSSATYSYASGIGTWNWALVTNPFPSGTYSVYYY